MRWLREYDHVVAVNGGALGKRTEQMVPRELLLAAAARKLKRFGIEPATPESWLLSHDPPKKVLTFL